jgi:hypothetical protein
MRDIMQSNKALILGAAVVAALAASACSSSSTSSNPTTQTYQQIERLARPAVKEAMQPYMNHDGTNRSSPFNPSDPLIADVNSFMTNVAGRDAQTTAAVAGILIPDVLISDLSKTGVGPAYLGVESGGATGSPFGGRGLHDDVIKTDLGAIFGSTVFALTGHDDGKESVCLADDNVVYGGKHDTTTFPYLGAPR